VAEATRSVSVLSDAAPDLTIASAAKRHSKARGVMRPLPAYSVFPSDLPITAEEIHKVLAALGPDLAALFEE
jgi:hypothetical protein